jgi:uncharacterized BrkB/YihY/UPF0761 family membrane protein
VATLLLWLYFTGAAILIGGEANSEIEKAASEAGRPDAEKPGERRSGRAKPDSHGSRNRPFLCVCSDSVIKPQSAR